MPSLSDASSVVKKAMEKDSRRAAFRAYMAALELSHIALEEKRISPRMLDIGGAYGIHARFFRRNIPDLHVDVIDSVPTNEEELIFTGFYDDFNPTEPYDYVWASHVLEHVPSPTNFFAKLYRDLKIGGWAAITVPPLRHEMTFAHLSLWNAGLLLVHFINAGFDCSKAHVATYNYNVSVLVQKIPRGRKPKADSLPPGLTRKGPYFMGDIERLAWQTALPAMEAPLGKPASLTETEAFMSGKSSAFCQFVDAKGRHAAGYWDAEAASIFRVG